MAKEKFAHLMELPPATPQPNVYPLNWVTKTARMEEIWDASQREYWDPKKLPWDTFDVALQLGAARSHRLLVVHPLGVRRLGAAGVRRRLIKTYEAHEEDAVRRCFFSVTRDEQNHEQMCGMAITKLLEAPILPRIRAEDRDRRKAKKNVAWLYFNGGRYWDGYKRPCRSTAWPCCSPRS
jgi:hypothetical protein